MKKKKDEIIFREGKKVILRPVKEEDVPLFQKWLNDPEVTQYVRTFMPVSLEDEREWFKRVSKTDPQNFTLAIVDKKSGELIGSIGIHRIDYKSRIGSTGTIIGSKKHWGKGFGTDAKMLILEFAFNELNLRKIYSDVISYNERSLAYAKKCGYNEEARLPNHFYCKGKYYDQVILAVYQDGWEKLWNEFSEA